MQEPHLENKLIEFKAHYQSLAGAIAVLRSAMLNEMEEIETSQLEGMVELLYNMTEDRTEKLNNIIDEFQETYCKQETELV